jgi:DNA excision repair protein ERCC-2
VFIVIPTSTPRHFFDRAMTAPWIRNKASADTTLCSFYENFDKNLSMVEIPRGVYSLEDLKELGRGDGLCPYFFTRYAFIYFSSGFCLLNLKPAALILLHRHMIRHANILVYNYQYILDPKVSSLVSRELEAESIVVFDEAHNIDNVCIEALSVTLDKRALDQVLYIQTTNIKFGIAHTKTKIFSYFFKVFSGNSPALFQSL